MKKRFALLLSIIMVVTFIVPSMGFAVEHDKELETAIVRVKELFNITKDYDKFDWHMNSYNGITEYNLSWNDTSNKLGNIYVSVDQKGFIRSYSNYKPYFGRFERKLPDISREEGQKIAENFIKKVSPELSGKFKHIENNQPLTATERYYYYSFARTENGIPFYANTINVTVDNRNGTIESYYNGWSHEISFPDIKGVISKEKASEIFKEEIGLKLMYKLSYDEDQVKPYLVYSVMDGNKAIDAKSGEVVDYNSYYYDRYAMEKSMDSGGMGDLSPAEMEEINTASNIISKNDIADKAREFLKLDEEYKLRYQHLYSDWRSKDQYTWSMEFVKEQQEKTEYYYHQSASISMDARTGEIQSFYMYGPQNNEDKVKYDKDQALEIARDYIKEMHPDKIDIIEYQEMKEPIYEPMTEGELPRQYYFRFVRKENNVYFQENGFNINIDTVSGKVVNYNYGWYKGQLPSLEGTISLDKAYDALFEHTGLELQYITKQPYYYYDRYSYIQKEADQNIANLVYSVKRDKPANIDPKTGGLLDYNGKPYKEVLIEEYKDIDNSFAKKQIGVLAQYGISLPGDEFNPKAEITQREFLYLIGKAAYPYWSFSMNDLNRLDKNLYELLMREGIVKEGERNPDSIVTKEEAVKYIIRILGYDRVADIQDIYTVPFIDVDNITPDLKGYVAIAYGLNIVNGNKGYFNPTSKLTREQAAIVIYNYLNSN